eukprot:UN24379
MLRTYINNSLNNFNNDNYISEYTLLEFQKDIENFMIENLELTVKPQPNRFGLNVGNGKFNCKQNLKWDKENCLLLTGYIESMMNVKSKRLSTYLTGIILDNESSLRNTYAETLQFSLQITEYLQNYISLAGLKTPTVPYSFSTGSGGGFHIDCGKKKILQAGGGGGVEFLWDEKWTPKRQC